MNYIDQQEVRQAKAAERAAREAQVEQDEVVCTILRTPAGRKWLHDKLVMCNTFCTPYAVDSDATIFNCGQQNVGFQLLADIMSASPDLYVIMMKENTDGRPNVERPAEPDSDPVE